MQLTVSLIQPVATVKDLKDLGGRWKMVGKDYKSNVVSSPATCQRDMQQQSKYKCFISSFQEKYYPILEGVSGLHFSTLGNLKIELLLKQ